MIFDSIAFVLFFLIVAIFYYIFPGKFRWVWLLLSGIFFYMYSNPMYILAPAFIILITYYAGIRIEKAASSQKAMQFYLTAIIASIGVLVFFKYTNFLTSITFDFINFTGQKIFHSTETFSNSLLINIIAPLGISYITFQAIGYLIEIKRGNHPAEKNLGHFSTYLLFFPKITAGPIERAHNFLPQLKKGKRLNYSNISSGSKLVLWGLFKKLVIADRVAIYASAILNNAEHHSGISLILGIFFYVVQMYADFSGYIDMARGFAKILGFDIMENFNRPFLAKSVTEFWRRWHISLSTWFRDYVYTPITIAKRNWNQWSVVYAFFVTFIVLGFWHGANWTFIVFGALQGLILTLEFFTRKVRRKIIKKIPGFLNTITGIVFTVSYFAFSLIFFRAHSVMEALTIIKRIFTAKGPLFIEGDPSSLIYSFMGILILFLVELKLEYYKGGFSFFNNRYWLLRNLSYAFLVICILLFGVLDGGQFIYFQF